MRFVAVRPPAPAARAFSFSGRHGRHPSSAAWLVAPASGQFLRGHRAARYPPSHPGIDRPMSSRRPSAKKRYARDSKSRKKHVARVRAWRTLHQHEVNARRRHLWATDPDYRARKLAESRSSIERRRHKAKRDPVYRAKLRRAKRTNSRRSFLRTQYGISLEDYDAMLKRQGGVCAICRKRSAERLCVDHCHVTRKVRGLLCRKCNFGLGHFSDDPDLVEAAAAYLRRASRLTPCGSGRSKARARASPSARCRG
jgi:recombination endonuclease VII